MADALATHDESADPLDIDARLAERLSRGRHATDLLVQFDRQIFQMVSHCGPPLSNAGESGAHSRLDKTVRIIEPVQADAEDRYGKGHDKHQKQDSARDTKQRLVSFEGPRFVAPECPDRNRH